MDAMTVQLPLVRVLGPIDIVTGSGAVPIGGSRRRALLAALTVGAGHAIPVDHLIWLIWGDHPPRTSTSTLQSQVSHLREVLGSDAIIRAGNAYELSTEHAAIDARRFEELFHQAEQARSEPGVCVELCRTALTLWRGRPFGEFADDEGFVLEALRLDELRSNATELSLEAEMALGRTSTVVAELEAAVREQPYRERLWRLLIEALAQSERRVEALRACAEFRAVLRDVGLTAEPWVTTLEHSIASGEPSAGLAIGRFDAVGVSDQDSA